MTALSDLEAVDQSIQQVTALLTQADQCIEQSLQAAADFMTAHGEHVPTAPLLHQALTDVQTNIHSLTDQHNRLVGQIAQARTEAQQVPEIPDNPY
jgi:prefoldin subunit 5